MSANAVPLIGLGILLIFGAIFFMANKSKGTKKAQEIQKKATTMVNDITNFKKPEFKKTSKQEQQSAYIKNPNANLNKEDIFNFMEFDKIRDNMIISKKGEKYTAVIKCKGINYNLMSEVEQLAVEEGFINFLNTLRFPIQLYVQALNIDLKDSIKKFKSNIEPLEHEYEEINKNYNTVINSLESSDEQIRELEDRKESILNVVEYGQDIVNYVEKLSVNKSMLQRNFYVLVSYYKSEITNVNNFSKEEVIDICYSELFTRVQNILSGLNMSSVLGEALNSNEIAELLYSAYNRDDRNYINIKQALDSGFHRLYSTSKDAIEKKNERLLENMKVEAEAKAVQALAKALETGNIVTMADIEDSYEEQTSKMAIDLIKNERLEPDIKEKAKHIVVEDYKEGKKIRNKEREDEKNRIKKQVEESKEEQEEQIVLEHEDKQKDVIENEEKENVEGLDTSVKEPIDNITQNKDEANNDNDDSVDSIV